MDIPAQTGWEDPPQGVNSVRTFRRVVRSDPAVNFLPFMGIVLLLPGVAGAVGALTGVDLREDVQFSVCNFGLALIGGWMLLWYALASQAQKNARELRLTVDATGLVESGYPNPKLNWQLTWAQVQRVELAGRGRYRVLRIYTPESGERPAHILGDYDFDELAPEINKRIGFYGKEVVMD